MGGIVTVEEYLSLTAAAEGTAEKLELVNGEPLARSDGSPEHARVAMNVAIALHRRLPARCALYSSDARVHVPDTGAYFYPDLTVVCGPREVAAADPLSITNPSLVVEVLSPATAAWDRGPKLAHYQRLPAMRDILLVDPEAARVERTTRQPDGQWLYEAAAGPGARLALRGHGVELELDELFAPPPA